jgi:multiple sugar transport system substrate-binding protein
MSERIILNVWFISSNNSYMNDVITLFVDLFEKDHPQIKINLELKHWNTVWEELLSTKGSSRAPDVVQIGSTWVGYLGQQGYLLGLNDSLKEVGGAEAFDTNMFKTCIQPGTGEIHALPWFIDIRGLYYREDILQKKELSVKDLATWDSFVSASNKINNIDIKGKKVPALGMGGGAKCGELLHNVMPFVWAAGGDIYNEETKEVTVNSEATLKGLEFFFNLFSQGLIPLHCLGLDCAQLTLEYFQGSYAICVTNVIDVFSMAYTESFYNIDIAKHCLATNFPTGPKGSYSFGGGSALGIMKGSIYPKEAWEFLRFLTGVEAQIYYAKSCGAIPAVKKAFNTHYFLTNPRFVAFNDIMKQVRYYPVLSQWGKIEEVLVNRLFEIYMDIGQNQGQADNKLLSKQMNAAALEIKELLKY